MSLFASAQGRIGFERAANGVRTRTLRLLYSVERYHRATARHSDVSVEATAPRITEIFAGNDVVGSAT
jgi:hypothetical protein